MKNRTLFILLSDFTGVTSDLWHTYATQEKLIEGIAKMKAATADTISLRNKYTSSQLQTNAPKKKFRKTKGKEKRTTVTIEERQGKIHSTEKYGSEGEREGSTLVEEPRKCSRGF